MVYEDLGKSWRRAGAMRLSGRKTVSFIPSTKRIIWLCRGIDKKSHRRKGAFRQYDIAGVGKKAAVGTMASFTTLIFWRNVRLI